MRSGATVDPLTLNKFIKRGLKFHGRSDERLFDAAALEFFSLATRGLKARGARSCGEEAVWRATFQVEQPERKTMAMIKACRTTMI